MNIIPYENEFLIWLGIGKTSRPNDVLEWRVLQAVVFDETGALACCRFCITLRKLKLFDPWKDRLSSFNTHKNKPYALSFFGHTSLRTFDDVTLEVIKNTMNATAEMWWAI